jgi:hypothetical protein
MNIKLLSIFNILLLLMCSSCALEKKSDKLQCPDGNSYPKHWWTEIHDPNKPSWEILPQAGIPCESVILSKRNELGILSNFAATPFNFEGTHYASVEGFWQSLLYPENERDVRNKWGQFLHSRKQVEQMSSFEAKKAGDFAEELMIKQKANWVTYKGKKIRYRDENIGEHYNLIKNVMLAKKYQNKMVDDVLRATGKLKLLPDHITSENDPKSWKYNEIWESIRSSKE